MAVKVYTAEEALAAVRADASKVLSAEKKKDDKSYKGTKFLNAHWSIGADVRKEGWFSVEDIELSDGMADPANLLDKRNEFDGTRLQLQTTVSRAGDFGQFLVLLNPAWRSLVETRSKDGTINATGRKIHDLLQNTLSENNEKNAGGIIEDPIIRFKVDFDAFPQRYPHKFLVGQPRTQFFDYRTEYLDERGVKQYKPAMVIDPVSEKEVPVTEKNIHLFVTAGSILRKGRVMMTSVAISQSWISLPIQLNRAVIEPGAEQGFSDEAPPAAANAALKTAFAVSDANTSTETKTVETTTEPPEPNTIAEEDSINDVLANI